jgi:phenylacetate-CoA ligase
MTKHRSSFATRAYWTGYLAWNMRQQARVPFRSPDHVARAQSARVRAMVAHAYRHVPYYRETMRRLGLMPDDLSNVRDLERLPIVERYDVQRDPERFASQHPRHCGVLRACSSGTMGIPLTVWHDFASLAQNAVHGERQRSIWASVIGQRVGYRETVITSSYGTAREVQELVSSGTLLPRAVRIQRQHLDVSSAVRDTTHGILAFRPHVLHSYGSYLNELFPYLKRQGIALPGLKLVTFASDGVNEVTRRLIEEGYGLPVMGTYQAIEAFQIGFECEQRCGYHLNVDLYPLRLVDAEGRTVPHGQTGEVVLSNLVNRATVLLNYRLRDLGVISPDPCLCGRSLPLLMSIVGRSDEFVTLPTGERLYTMQVHTMFKYFEDICQFQIRQTSGSTCEANVVAKPGCNSVALVAQLQNAFRARFGEAFRLEHVDLVDAIPRPPGGKPRIVLTLPDSASSGER